jgi:pSer/pThr/pTyr-binding forkhead associated (FHA) protein
MSVDRDHRGPLWVDGRFTVRVRGPGHDPGRVVRTRRPFALIGRLPEAEIRIDDPAVEDRHVFLLLDRRGVFGVDLLTRTGTRFAGASATSSRLGPGDVLEVAGRRVEILQLRVDGSVVDPPLSDHDPLAEADASTLAALTLEPLDVPGPPWMLGSALVFAGSGEACAIRIGGASASTTHCALLRGPSTAHVIDLLGRRTLLNGRPVDGASALRDGDILTIGQARFTARVEPPRGEPGARTLARIAENFEAAPGLPAGLDGDPRAALLALMLTGASREPGEPQGQILEALRLFQSDAATLFEAQLDRIEALGREIATLRDEIRRLQGSADQAPEPLRLNLPPRLSTDSVESAAWLLQRLNGLESESRSTWKDLIGRIASTVRPRTPSGTIPDGRT